MFSIPLTARIKISLPSFPMVPCDLLTQVASFPGSPTAAQENFGMGVPYMFNLTTISLLPSLHTSHFQAHACARTHAPTHVQKYARTHPRTYRSTRARTHALRGLLGQLPHLVLCVLLCLAKPGHHSWAGALLPESPRQPRRPPFPASPACLTIVSLTPYIHTGHPLPYRLNSESHGCLLFY
jgi:hypothetical protein